MKYSGAIYLKDSAKSKLKKQLQHYFSLLDNNKARSRAKEAHPNVPSMGYTTR
jgi:hypothetical protein